MLAGLTVMLGSAGAVTVNVTGTEIGPLEAVADEINTDPLYVPAARAAGLTETLTLPGVAPLAGVADNHEPPDAAAV
jgi:hypothetical protein